MRKLRVLYLVLSILAPLPTCQAQTGSWAAVESLSEGTSISVQTVHRSQCRFLSATEDSLACEQELALHGVARIVTFDRRSIQEVRLEHPAASALLGGAIGAGAGVGIGSIGGNNTYTPGARKFIGGAILGGFGAWIGGETHIIHGKVIYRR